MELGELDEVSFGRRFSFVVLFGEAADAAGDGYQASQRRHNYLGIIGGVDDRREGCCRY